MFKVAVVGPIQEEGMRLLRERPDIEAHVVQDLSPKGIAEGVAGADAISIRTLPLPREALARAQNLRVVSRYGVGCDNIDVDYLSSRKIPMAITANANHTAVSEHTMMMMLCLAKDTLAGNQAMLDGNYEWRHNGTLFDLMGKHVLILGFGRIGQRVATLCQAFGMKVYAYRHSFSASPVPGVEMLRDWRSMLPYVDYLSIHLPSTPETAGMIGEKELAAMKNTAFVINMARGGIIDEDALANALEKGVICGAGLDVFLHEPHDRTHPLFSQKRCIFSPHNAALSAECANRMASQCAQNILDALDGKLHPQLVLNGKEIGMR